MRQNGFAVHLDKEFRKKQHKIGRGFVICSIFIILFSGVIDTFPQWLSLLIGINGLIFFGGMLLISHRAEQSNQAYFLINTQGLTSGQGILRTFIQWDEIAEIAPYYYIGKLMLGVQPKKENTFLIRQHPFNRWLLKRCLNLSKILPFALLEGSSATKDEILEQITVYSGGKF